MTRKLKGFIVTSVEEHILDQVREREGFGDGSTALRFSLRQYARAEGLSLEPVEEEEESLSPAPQAEMQAA